MLSDLGLAHGIVDYGIWIMDLALASMVEGTYVRGSKMSCENVLMLYHKHMGHTSYGVLSWVYSHLFEKAAYVLNRCPTKALHSITPYEA